MSYQGIDYLRNKLKQKQPRVNLRYDYYEMKNLVDDFNIAIPAKWTWLTACLGWSTKAVDSLANRLSFREFAEDRFNMNEIFRLNSHDVFFRSSIISACIASCCFAYIYADGRGYPKLQVIDAYDATGIIDTTTMLLTEGYAVLDRDKQTGQPTLEAYFTAESTEYIGPDGKTVRRIPNPAPHPLLVPIVFRPDARRPFGRSRISRACMGVQQAALRELKRIEVTAEFYSFPQKYVTGLSPDNEMMEKWQATISSMLQFTKDDDGDHPMLGQFTTQSMSPHMEQMRIYANLFAGFTDLTPDDLGFVVDNPTSAESIRASHSNMLRTAMDAQKAFGTGFLNAGYLAACVRDDFPYAREEVSKTVPKWDPVFEADSAQLSGIGDAILKIQQAFPDYFTEEKLHDLTGI